MADRSQHPRLVTSLTPEFLNAPRKRRLRKKPTTPPSQQAARPTKQRRKPARKAPLQMESLETRAMLHGDEQHADASDHTHSHLTILIEGQKFDIPANVGVFNDHAEVIHTHNPHGVLHVEPGDTPETEIEVPTVGDFFDIWRTRGGVGGNKANAFFDSTRIFDNFVDANHTLKFYVNGVENTEFQNHVFDFSEELVIQYDSIANTAPTLVDLPNVTLQAGAPLIIPLDGFDADGDSLTFNVQSSNPSVTGSLMNGRSLRMTVQGFGEMVFQLFEDLAPRTTGHILELAESGFYDGVTFHRVINNFVIQGGDPTGTGSGGSELGNFDDEFNIDLQHTSKGLLSMAKSSDDTNDSQFFVTEVPTRHLDFNHSIFGKLIEGESVRDAISNVPTGTGDKPTSTVRIEGMTVFVDGQNRSLMLKAPVGATGTSTVTVTADDGHGGTVQKSFQVTIAADTTNNTPYFQPIGEPIAVGGDQPTTVTLKAVDAEGNAILFGIPKQNANGVIDLTTTNQQLPPLTFSHPNLDVTFAPSTATPNGQVAETVMTITRKPGFTGAAKLTVVAYAANSEPRNTSTADWQTLDIQVLDAAPGAPTVKLSANSDTGASPTDGVTQKNNNATSPLTFDITGVQSGATVKLFAGATQIGEAVATGTTVSITTNGTLTFPDGVTTVTATQALGGLTSPASTPINITVDTRQSQFTSSPIVTAQVGALYTYDAANDEEGTPGFLFGLISPPAGMTINPATGVVSWTPTGAQIGQHSVQIRATDLAGNFVDQTYTLSVENSAPTLNPVGNKSVDEAASLTFTATATDPNLPNDTLTFSLENGAPAGATINPSTGVFSWTPSEQLGGQSFTFTVRVTDQAGLFDDESITVTVNEVNQAPELAAIGDKAAVKDQLLTFTAVAADADQPAQGLTFSLGGGAPAGAAIDPATGVFTWTPSAAQAPGTFTITVRVSDGTAEDFEQIKVFVQDAPAAPEFPNVDNQTVNEGGTVALNLAASDANLPNDHFIYTIENGPAGATISAAGQFVWITTEVDGPGTHSITVKVTDATGLTDTATFSVTVNEVNQPPTLTPIGNKIVDEGDVLTFTAVGVDGDLPANTLTYSLGDGAPAGATINAQTGAFSWQTTEADGGQSFSITVRVSDGTVEASETITVSVAEVNQAPVLAAIDDRTVDEGGTVEFTVSAADADVPANTLTYSLDSGAPAGATIDPVTGVFHWQTTEADGPQTHTVTVRVSDGQGGSDTESFLIAVNEINVPPSLAEIDDITTAERTPITFNAVAGDADLPVNTLVFSLGAGAPAGATINPSTGKFDWTPTEAQGPGSYDITVLVTDGGGLSASRTFNVTVTEVNDPPVISEIADRTVAVGSTLAIDVVATDPDVPAGGALEYSLNAGAPAGMAIDPTTGKITWTPTAAQSGQAFDVTVRVKDSTGQFAEETFRATVNAAPVLDAIVDQAIDEETLLTITAHATDDGTVTYSLGDGAPAGLSIDSATGAIRWTPTEADGPGEFEVTVIATDEFGLASEQSFTVAVREVNLVPVIAPIEKQSGNAGQELTFTVSASDADLPAQGLTFSLEPGAPAGATIDAATGAFRWLVPADFRESSVDIIVRVTDAEGLSSTVTVNVSLTDQALALFTASGADRQGLSDLLAARARNVSSVVVQQAAARQAAAAALNRFEPALDAADLAYLSGRIFRLGPADGSGVGPVPTSKPSANPRDRQRALKPPVNNPPAPPTSDRTRTNDGAPITHLEKPAPTQAALTPPASAPVMDETFDAWSDDDVATPVEETEATFASPVWMDDAVTESIAEEQSAAGQEEPSQASLGMIVLPLVAGEMLQRRRQRAEEDARRKPR